MRMDNQWINFRDTSEKLRDRIVINYTVSLIIPAYDVQKRCAYQPETGKNRLKLRK